MDCMVRPCFLIVDREFSSGISSRKLVIETAKFNVISAYSFDEALETLAVYPAVNGAVVDEHADGKECSDFVIKLKQMKPNLTVVAVGSPGNCGPADFHVEPFNPAKLLQILQRLQPTATAAIEQTNQALSEMEDKQP